MKVDLMDGIDGENGVLGGFVRLVDCMPRYCEEGQTADHAICRAARVSYDGHETKGRSDSAERGLIRYLMRHRHTSPFEMAEFTFHVKAPIFVARQWMRHRTGSFNEISARYSVISDEYHLPIVSEMGVQSTDNKQGRDESGISRADASAMIFSMQTVMSQAHAQYQHLVGQGLARELARTVLPVATYTEFYWKVDLLNLLKFLHLRIDKHAQHEIRVYAQSIAKIVERIAPWSYDAFSTFWIGAPNISSLEWVTIVNSLTDQQCESILEMLSHDLSKRELADLKSQFDDLRSDG